MAISFIIKNIALIVASISFHISSLPIAVSINKVSQKQVIVIEVEFPITMRLPIHHLTNIFSLQWWQVNLSSLRLWISTYFIHIGQRIQFRLNYFAAYVLVMSTFNHLQLLFQDWWCTDLLIRSFFFIIRLQLLLLVFIVLQRFTWLTSHFINFIYKIIELILCIIYFKLLNSNLNSFLCSFWPNFL